MNGISVQQKRFIRLAPSNNSSTGYSPINSQPTIRFSLADTQALALLPDARLNARVKIEKTTGVAVDLLDDFNIDPVTGFCGLFDQLIVSSRRFGNTLEQVMNLGRLESSFYRTQFSPKQMSSNYFYASKGVGYGKYTGLNSPSHSNVAGRASDPRFQAMRKSLVTTISTNPKDPGFTEISVPFHVGLFLSGDGVDLSQVGGLELSIFLQKPDQFYFGGAVTSTSNFTLYDVSITVPLLYKSALDIQQTPPESVVQFLNWTSLYSVLDSTTSSISQRLHLNGLVSSMHNMLPTAQINNRSYNSMALKNPGVERVTFMRDGQRAPLEKTNIVATTRTLAVEDKETNYCECLQDYISAWKPPKSLLYSQIIPENIRGVSNANGVFGLGCNYSPDSSGINMSGVLGLDVQSKIEDITTPNSAGTEPYALYSFYLSRQSFLVSKAGMKAV